MENNGAARIKNYLEDFYDIPFDVAQSMHYRDTWFDIKPHNSARELFDIEVKFKDNIRIIIEVKPEKFAAFSIKDMGAASENKKRMFAEYAGQLLGRKAKMDFYINDQLCDATKPDSWPYEWKNYKLRISRSPICSEDELFDEVKIATSWASVVTGMFLSLLDVIQIDDREYLEGGSKKVTVNRYERNPVNRELCIAANGYKCKICGFDFARAYGEIGQGFIHVHHIVPISKMTEAYAIDPVNDLIPVCPNCHSMLHRTDPPLLPEELMKIIRDQASEK